MSGLQPKTDQEIEVMRTGGRILAEILQYLKQQAKPGVTPKTLAGMAKNQLRKRGAQAAFLGYQDYPDVICISVNNQVQHSIPSDRPLANGDIINLDFGVRYGGMVTDGGVSFIVGTRIDPHRKRLVEGTRQALEAGLSMVHDGCRVGDISAAIEAVLRRQGLGIVRELVGHGVGHELHEEPEIPNYGLAGRGPVLRTGMTVAIEPIANLGGKEIVGDPDGWTIWTADGSDSAQFEHTVVVTNDGYEVLTST